MSVKEIMITERRTANQLPDDVYDDGYLRVEHRNYYVACNGVSLKLPRTEFLIFSRLVRTPNRIVTSDELWSSVWGANKPLNSESLHVYIYRLRAKLAEFGLQIETMVNVGYRLIINTPELGRG
ncbi:MAG TPA: helix-turn-helix domain-containing protein [Pyrinomonadaceae bacterium]|nr:helix-turn-helix domain-containing protein [Pyrinomonadaceae bacterium]